MKKIFVYNGSYKKTSSSITFKVIESIIDKIKCEYAINVVTPTNKKINQCIGCSKCFSIGECSLEKYDEMEEVKNMIESSDIIIFSSPVYLGSITGSFKVFLDRIAYWSHLLHLKGKPTVIVVSSNGNSSDMALNYLSNISTCMGAKVISEINFEHRNSSDFDSFIDSYDVNRAAELINRYLTGSIEVKSDIYLDNYFDTLRNIVMCQNESSSEYKYWKSNGYFEMKTFQDVIDRRQFGK